MNQLQVEVLAGFSFKTTTLSNINIINSCLNESLRIAGTSYSKESEMISLNMISKSELEINKFVKRLYDTGLFLSVNYSGYSYSFDTDEYSFTVEAVFKLITQ